VETGEVRGLKYWSYFAAKLALIAGFIWLLWQGALRWMPEPGEVMYHKLWRYQDLRWIAVMMALWLLAAGLCWLAVFDQRRRCRVCLARLRMPVSHGMWSAASLFAPPRTESICPFGHGTLNEPEVRVAGKDVTEWKRHDDDIWRELERAGKE
jgi:hypothetical protein